jgi:hypothetical protein
MKIERRKLVVGMGLVATTPVYAQFGGLGGLVGGKSGGGGGGDVDGQVKGFLDKSINIETTLNKALLAIVAAYSKDEDRAKYQARFQELGKQTDPKEAGAKFQETYQSSEADAKKLASTADLELQTKQLTAEKQQQVSKGVVNFLLGALQAKDVIPMGQNIMQSVSANPMALPKVLPIKDAVPRLTNAISLAASTMPQFVKVLRGANIKVADVTASTKEEKIESI